MAISGFPSFVDEMQVRTSAALPLTPGSHALCFARCGIPAAHASSSGPHVVKECARHSLRLRIRLHSVRQECPPSAMQHMHTGGGGPSCGEPARMTDTGAWPTQERLTARRRSHTCCVSAGVCPGTIERLLRRAAVHLGQHHRIPAVPRAHRRRLLGRRVLPRWPQL